MASLLTRVLRVGSVGDDVYVSRLRERLFAKIHRRGPRDCWEWTAYRSAKGYGQIGVARKVMPAHRVIYELLVGPIPDGMVIDHLCRNQGTSQDPNQGNEINSGVTKVNVGDSGVVLLSIMCVRLTPVGFAHWGGD